MCISSLLAADPQARVGEKLPGLSLRVSVAFLAAGASADLLNRLIRFSRRASRLGDFGQVARNLSLAQRIAVLFRC